MVNQIFFTLWHKANKIDPLKSVTIKGYLGTLARNTAINEKKKCIPDYQINDEVIADISDDFNQVELRLLLANALRKLNKDEQLILVLFYFQNEKIADISRIDIREDKCICLTCYFTVRAFCSCNTRRYSCIKLKLSFDRK
mgnify:CR=1 FL=1